MAAAAAAAAAAEEAASRARAAAEEAAAQRAAESRAASVAIAASVGARYAHLPASHLALLAGAPDSESRAMLASILAESARQAALQPERGDAEQQGQGQQGQGGGDASGEGALGSSESGGGLEDPEQAFDFSGADRHSVGTAHDVQQQQQQQHPRQRTDAPSLHKWQRQQREQQQRQREEQGAGEEAEEEEDDPRARLASSLASLSASVAGVKRSHALRVAGAGVPVTEPLTQPDGILRTPMGALVLAPSSDAAYYAGVGGTDPRDAAADPAGAYARARAALELSRAGAYVERVRAQPQVRATGGGATQRGPALPPAAGARRPSAAPGGGSVPAGRTGTAGTVISSDPFPNLRQRQQPHEVQPQPAPVSARAPTPHRAAAAAGAVPAAALVPALQLPLADHHAGMIGAPLTATGRGSVAGGSLSARGPPPPAEDDGEDYLHDAPADSLAPEPLLAPGSAEPDAPASPSTAAARAALQRNRMSASDRRGGALGAIRARVAAGARTITGAATGSTSATARAALAALLAGPDGWPSDPSESDPPDLILSGLLAKADPARVAWKPRWGLLTASHGLATYASRERAGQDAGAGFVLPVRKGDKGVLPLAGDGGAPLVLAVGLEPGSPPPSSAPSPFIFRLQPPGAPRAAAFACGSLDALMAWLGALAGAGGLDLGAIFQTGVDEGHLPPSVLQQVLQGDDDGAGHGGWAGGY